MTFEDLMQKYVNTDYDVLRDLAKEAANRLMPTCKQVDPDHDGNYMLASIVLSAVAADGTVTALEQRMIKDVLGLDDEGIQKFVKMYDSRMVELTDRFCDKINDDVKADTIMLFTTFAAVDEKIAKEETALIRKLFE